MLDNNPTPHTRRARNTNTTVAAVVGALLGVASPWTDGSGLVLLGTTAIIIGFCASLWKPSFGVVMVAVAASLIAATLCGLISSPSWAGAILGLVRGTIYTLCLVVPVLTVAALRGRRAYLQRGWDLALAEAREHDARVEQAVMRERDAMASEIHDGLGHRLTLIAVQAGRLSLDDTLPATARTELQSIRANAAAASDELGETVRLITERDSGITASLSGLSIEDVLERAQSSGIEVNSTLAPDIERFTNNYSRAALLRALQEGLTNAAKHAPGTKVNIDINIDGDEVELRIRNPDHGTTPTVPITGHGILALRHRVGILGGTLDVNRSENFTLTVRLPRSATPSSAATSTHQSRTELVTAADSSSDRKRRRTTRAAWLVPIVLLSTAALSAIGYFAYANVASVLTPERFAAINTGDTRTKTELLLPAVEMLDAPRTSLAQPPRSTCEFYEASISFFDRDDVFRICFVNNRVLATDTILAP